jgi:hypothetical protein
MTYIDKRKELDDSDYGDLCDDCWDSYVSGLPHMKYWWNWEAWDRDHIAGEKIKKKIPKKNSCFYFLKRL